MNAGPIAHRYAKALLKFVQETGNGDKVYAQAGILALRLQAIRQLKLNSNRETQAEHNQTDPQNK